MGLLDGPLRGIAKQLIGVLGGTATLKRYDPTLNITDSWPLQITPLEEDSYSVFRAGGGGMQKGDKKVYVAIKYLEDNDIPLPIFQTEMKHTYLSKDGEDYWVKGAEIIRSGDLGALITIHCESILEVLRRAGHTIKVLQPSQQKTPTGGVSPQGAFLEVKTVYPCWVVPVGVQVQEQAAKRGFRITHEIYCAVDPQVGPDWRVEYNGRQLRVNDVVNELDMDKLWVIRAEE
jgi:hypothetical protein